MRLTAMKVAGNKTYNNFKAQISLKLKKLNY